MGNKYKRGGEVLIPVKSNVYDIPQRLREIDSNYFVMYNTESDKFEVHHSKQIGGTLALNIPYSELDSRTLELVRKTSVENSKIIYDEMERNNKAIKDNANIKIMAEAEAKTRELFHYAKGSEHRETVPEEAIRRW